jgi:hypothetical protein
VAQEEEAAVEVAMAMAALRVVSSGDQWCSLVAPCSARSDITTIQGLAGFCGI